MKKLIIPLFILIFSAQSNGVSAEEPAPALDSIGSAAAVDMTDNAYNPADLTITAGTSVTWVNRGAQPHTVTADNNDFGSGTINTNQSFSATFNSPGIYRYYCKFHGSPNGGGMAGIVTVVSAGEAPPKPTDFQTPRTGPPIWAALVLALTLTAGFALVKK